jgi:hypothetical protein
MTPRLRMAGASWALLPLGGALIAVGACGHRPGKSGHSAPVPDVVTLTDRDMGKSVTVRPDATVVVRLPALGGGRRWDYLWEAGHNVLRPLPATPEPGGVDTLRFALTPSDDPAQERLYCLAPAPGPNWLRGARLWQVTLVCPSGERGAPPEGLGPSPPGRPAGGVVEIGEGEAYEDAGHCYRRTPVSVEPGAVVTAQLSQPDYTTAFYYLWDLQDTSLRPLTDSAARMMGGGHTTQFTFRFAVGRAIRGRTERLRFVRGRLWGGLSGTQSLQFLLKGR